MSVSEDLKHKIGLQSQNAIVEKPDTEGKNSLKAKIALPAAIDAKISRQIDQSAEALVIAKFNEDHFVSVDGGRTLVFREDCDYELNTPKLTHMTPKSFHDLHANETVFTANGERPISKVWWHSSKRRTYTSGFALLPGGKAPDGVYNLWAGFGCDPANEATLFEVRIALWHLKYVICDGDKPAFRYLLAWLARAAQYPDLPAEVATVLLGAQGSGKSTLGRWFCDLFGSHGKHIQQTRHLVGNFNAHLRTALALFVDEAFFAGDKAGANILKALVTENSIAIEQKGLDVVTARNRLKIMMATNSAHAIRAAGDERRFFVVSVSDCKKQDHEYFAKLHKWWNSGGKEKLLSALLNYNLDGFNVRKVPNTGALEDQKLQSLEPLDAWLFEMLQDAENWKTELTRKTWSSKFLEYCQRNNHRFENTTRRTVGRGLRKRLIVTSGRQSTGFGSGRERTWKLPGIDDARAQFTDSLGLIMLTWDDG